MNKVGVIADSAICLPKELIAEYGIRLVPETIIFGEKVYRDGFELVPQDFYPLLAKAKELPTTSAPSPKDFADAYQEVASGADSIACILVTSGFSSMGLQSALAAKETFTSVPLEIIDSRTAVGAYGFVVLAAAQAAAAGRSLAEVITVAEDIKKRVHMIIALDTLKYVAKGGRIGKAACWAGGLLNVKPIIEVPTSTGVIEPVERVRSRRKSLKRLLEIMEARVGRGLVHTNISHANAPSEADTLREQVLAGFNCAEVYISDFAPVVGVHTGPGVIGLAFYSGD